MGITRYTFIFNIVAQGYPAYPAKPLRLIAPFPIDASRIAAHLFSEKLAEPLGQGDPRGEYCGGVVPGSGLHKLQKVWRRKQTPLPQ